MQLHNTVRLMSFQRPHFVADSRLCPTWDADQHFSCYSSLSHGLELKRQQSQRGGAGKFLTGHRENAFDPKWPPCLQDTPSLASQQTKTSVTDGLACMRRWLVFSYMQFAMLLPANPLICIVPASIKVTVNRGKPSSNLGIGGHSKPSTCSLTPFLAGQEEIVGDNGNQHLCMQEQGPWARNTAKHAVMR